MKIGSIVLLVALVMPLYASEFYVSEQGEDARFRDGQSWDNAWRSLAYACDRVPAGDHRIQLGSGFFRAERTAYPKSGVTIMGRGNAGDRATILVATPGWALSDDPSRAEIKDEYLVCLYKVNKVTLRDMVLQSPPTQRLTGGLLCRNSERIGLHRLYVSDFRWAGLSLEHSRHLDVNDCTIRDASTEKHRYHNGLIRTRWLKHSAIHHNRILSTIGRGYGYKGGGHEDVRFHHNVVDVNSGFAFESAHENEYGVEIDHNYMTRCISIPKSGQGADPNQRGFDYSFWVHHNVLTDSYTVEGPRNHLRLCHNYIFIQKPNGRVYTHHGGNNHGPIWIHHNVVENVDRAFVWMNQGLAENIYVYNNTVLCANAGSRAGSIFGAWSGERLNNWVIQNNIFIAPSDQRRKLIPSKRDVPDKMIVKNNLYRNCTGVPRGNHGGYLPGFFEEGDKPWPYYAPAEPNSYIVDRGVDVGLPYSGLAPDLGAFEYSLEEPIPPIPSLENIGPGMLDDERAALLMKIP